MPSPNPNSMLLPTPDFNHLFEIAMIQAKEHVDGGKLTGYIPVAYLLCFEPPAHKQAIIAVLPDFDVDHRYEYLEAYGEFCAQEGYLVMAFLLVTETWGVQVTAQDDEEARAVLDRVQPKNHPDRYECITAMGQTVDGRMAMSMMRITRDKHKNMVAGEITHMPYDEDKPAPATSDLCNAFWRGFQKGLRTKLMESALGRQAVRDMEAKAPGKKPGTPRYNFKFN